MKDFGIIKNYTGEEKFGLLKDGTIVKIFAFSDPDYDLEEQEIFFNYRFLDRLKFKKESAWSNYKFFIGFSDKVRTLKRAYKKWQG